MLYTNDVMALLPQMQEVVGISKVSQTLKVTLDNGEVVFGNFGGIHIRPNSSGGHCCITEINTIPRGYLHSVDMARVVKVASQ